MELYHNTLPVLHCGVSIVATTTGGLEYTMLSWWNVVLFLSLKVIVSIVQFSRFRFGLQTNFIALSEAYYIT